MIFGAKLLRKELVSFVCNFVRSSDTPCGSQHGASSRPPAMHWPHSGEGGPWVCVVFEATLWPPFPATQLFSWLSTLMKPNYLLKNDVVSIAPIVYVYGMVWMVSWLWMWTCVRKLRWISLRHVLRSSSAWISDLTLVSHGRRQDSSLFGHDHIQFICSLDNNN